MNTSNPCEKQITFGSKGFRAGYLFKPTHYQIHYVKKGATGDRRRRYDHNYTRDIDEALVGFNEDRVRSAIVNLVSRFYEGDDYCWTPVLVDVATDTYQQHIDGEWHNTQIQPKIGSI